MVRFPPEALTPETLMALSTEAVSTPAIADHPVRAALLLGALGVVFGDIGTSPIYAFRELLKAAGGASEAAEHVVLLKVTTEHSPRVDEKNRVKVTPLASGFRLLWLVFGFAEKPDVPAALRLHPEALECDPDEASFFLGRETPVPSLRPHLSAWQQRLYAFMTRNAVAAPDYFLIPPPRVVELGTRVEM